jgi:CheY-like chemotaxis protein
MAKWRLDRRAELDTSILNQKLKKERPSLMKQATVVRPMPRLLLVEEQAVSRDLVLLVLGRLHYQIDAVSTAAAALERLQQGHYALVLLSTTLPDMAGDELVVAMRARAPGGGPPILALCPSADSPAGEACRAAGAIDSLCRPIEIDRMLRVVERTTRNGNAGASAAARPPVIDLEHLLSFTNGDLGLEGELSTLYRSSAEVYLARMDQALQTGGSWSGSVHALKGASANLGARRVAALARAAEHAPPSRSQLTALRASIDEVTAFFDQRSA